MRSCDAEIACAAVKAGAAWWTSASGGSLGENRDACVAAASALIHSAPVDVMDKMVVGQAA